MKVLLLLHVVDIHVVENRFLSPAGLSAEVSRLCGPSSGRRSGMHASITASEGSTAVIRTAVTDVYVTSL